MYRRCKTESRFEDKSLLEYKLKNRQEYVQPLDCLLSERSRELKAASLRIRSWCYWSTRTFHCCQQCRGLALGKSIFQNPHFVGVKVLVVTQGFEADAQEKYILSEVQLYELPTQFSLCFWWNLFLSLFPFFSAYSIFHSRSFSPLSMLFK